MNKANPSHQRNNYGSIISVILVVAIVSCGEINDVGQAEFRRGEAAYAAHDFSDAVLLFLEAAERGHVEAQVRLAECYLDGRGVE